MRWQADLVTEPLPRPEPGQRLLALRVIPTRLALLSILASCVPGPLDPMAVSRCVDRVSHELHVLVTGCAEHVQEVLDVELAAFGEWVIVQLYEPRRLDVGRSVLARWLAAYEEHQVVRPAPGRDVEALAQLHELATDVDE